MHVRFLMCVSMYRLLRIYLCVCVCISMYRLLRVYPCMCTWACAYICIWPSHVHLCPRVFSEVQAVAPAQSGQRTRPPALGRFPSAAAGDVITWQLLGPTSQRRRRDTNGGAEDGEISLVLISSCLGKKRDLFFIRNVRGVFFSFCTLFPEIKDWDLFALSIVSRNTIFLILLKKSPSITEEKEKKRRREGKAKELDNHMVSTRQKIYFFS